MPTRRMIDPAFWQSETIASLSISQRYLFIGLFSNADDQGRLRGNPALIRSMVFPYDDIPASQIEADLKAIQVVGSITLYEVDGKQCIQVAGWWDYQTPQWAYPSKLPPPAGWADRLRYRQNNQVVQDNWDGQKEAPAKPLPKDEDDGNINEGNALGNGLGKDLPKDLGNGLGYTHSIVQDSIEIELIPNGIGAEAPLEPSKLPDKEPEGGEEKPEDKPDGPRKQLMGTFQTETNLKLPHNKSDQGFWWKNIGEIYEIACRDTDVGKRLIQETVAYMRQEHLTISGPQSVINICRSLASGQELGQKGHTNGQQRTHRANGKQNSQQFSTSQPPPGFTPETWARIVAVDRKG